MEVRKPTPKKYYTSVELKETPSIKMDELIKVNKRIEKRINELRLILK